MALQKFCEKLFLEQKTPDHERLVLLVYIMNVLGFSKNEREIHIYSIHLRNALVNNVLTTDKVTVALKGNTSEGMCGGIYNNKRHHE